MDSLAITFEIKHHWLSLSARCAVRALCAAVCSRSLIQIRAHISITPSVATDLKGLTSNQIRFDRTLAREGEKEPISAHIILCIHYRHAVLYVVTARRVVKRRPDLSAIKLSRVTLDVSCAEVKQIMSPRSASRRPMLKHSLT